MTKRVWEQRRVGHNLSATESLHSSKRAETWPQTDATVYELFRLNIYSTGQTEQTACMQDSVHDAVCRVLQKANIIMHSICPVKQQTIMGSIETA